MEDSVSKATATAPMVRGEWSPRSEVRMGIKEETCVESRLRKEV